MIAASAVVWKLKSIGAITNLTGTRIYPGLAPQGAQFPYIVVDRPPGQVNLGEHAGGQGSLNKSPVVVFCFADRSEGGIKQASTIAKLVRSNLAPVSGVTGSVQWNGTWIDHVSVNDQYEASIKPQEGDELGWRCMAGGFDVFHLNCESGDA